MLFFNFSNFFSIFHNSVYAFFFQVSVSLFLMLCKRSTFLPFSLAPPATANCFLAQKNSCILNFLCYIKLKQYSDRFRAFFVRHEAVRFDLVSINFTGKASSSSFSGVVAK